MLTGRPPPILPRTRKGRGFLGVKINSRRTLLQRLGDLCDRIGPVQTLYKLGQVLPLNVGCELLDRVEGGLAESEKATKYMPQQTDDTAERERLVHAAKTHVSMAREHSRTRGEYRLPPTRYK